MANFTDILLFVTIWTNYVLIRKSKRLKRSHRRRRRQKKKTQQFSKHSRRYTSRMPSGDFNDSKISFNIGRYSRRENATQSKEDVACTCGLKPAPVISSDWTNRRYCNISTQVLRSTAYLLACVNMLVQNVIL